MRNKIILLILIYFFNLSALADNINISAKNIILDKNNSNSVFKNEVSVLTVEGDKIESDYAEYNKETGILILKDNIIFKDKLDNTLTTNFLEYKEYEKILITSGPTKIITSENYVLDGYDLSLDKNKNLVVSKKKQ